MASVYKNIATCYYGEQYMKSETILVEGTGN